MRDSPLPLGTCFRGPNSVTAGDLTGMGHRSIVVVRVPRAEPWRSSSQRPQGTSSRPPCHPRRGWGSVAVARLTPDRRSEIITADNDAGTITIYFPE